MDSLYVALKLLIFNRYYSLSQEEMLALGITSDKEEFAKNPNWVKEQVLDTLYRVTGSGVPGAFEITSDTTYYSEDIVFSWTPSQGATHYEYIFDSDPGTTEETEIEIEGVSEGEWEFLVRACNELICGSYRQVWIEVVVPPAPEILTPTHEQEFTEDNDILITWTDIGATSWSIMVDDTDDEFESLVVDLSGLEEPEYLFENVTNGTYYVTVAGTNDLGTGDSSEVVEFTVNVA